MSKVISLSEDVQYQTWRAPNLKGDEQQGTQTHDHPLFKPAVAEPAITPEPKQDVEAAIEEAYNRGLLDGQKQAGITADSQKQQLQEIIQAMVKPVERINDAVEAELVELVLAIAKLILRREISEDPRHIVGLIREAVKQLPAASLNVRIHLNPDDALVVQAVLGESEQSSLWSIEQDPSMKPGDCQIYTNTSFIDAGIDGLINRLGAEMLGGQRASDRHEASDHGID